MLQTITVLNSQKEFIEWCEDRYYKIQEQIIPIYYSIVDVKVRKNLKLSEKGLNQIIIKYLYNYRFLIMRNDSSWYFRWYYI